MVLYAYGSYTKKKLAQTKVSPIKGSSPSGPKSGTFTVVPEPQKTSPQKWIHKRMEPQKMEPQKMQSRGPDNVLATK